MSLLPYVPSHKHNIHNFTWRMKYYADHVAGNIQGNGNPSGTTPASNAGTGMQSPGNTPSSPSINPTTPSLRNVGFSSASINMNRDKCEVCHGTKGGVPGNENVINGKIVCDYCHADGSYKPLYAIEEGLDHPSYYGPSQE